MFSKHCKVYDFPPIFYVIMVEEYAVKCVFLDICVVVGKTADKYPFYCDNYLSYVLFLELISDYHSAK
ncbi:hypothetical protein CTT30_02245 [Vibrio coralliilyticus]|nr:hypothetical protein CTT30_02245 [Vibrio coralliilyticus]